MDAARGPARLVIFLSCLFLPNGYLAETTRIINGCRMVTIVAQHHDIVTQHTPYRLECLRYDQSDGECLQKTASGSWMWAPQLVELPSQGSLFGAPSR